MTIDEVIEHAKELARTSENNQSAAKYIQLTEWLRRARGAEKASRWYTERIRKLEAKNAKLRTQLTDVTESMGRVEERCAKLRGERDHWHVEQVHAYSNWEDAHKRASELEAENAKLLKIVSCLLTCANDTGDCDRCPINGGTGDWDSGDFCDDLLDCLRKLGIEVQK